MIKNYPELMALLQAVATEEVTESVSTLANRLGIPTDLFVYESIPRVKFMIKTLTSFLKTLDEIQHATVQKPLKRVRGYRE